MTERLREFFTARRAWRIQLYTYAGPWWSLGVHVDVAPQVDLHLGWVQVRVGRIRTSELENGKAFP